MGEVQNARDLAMAVAETPLGRTVRLGLWRENHSLSVAVTIRPQEERQAANAAIPRSTAQVGMTLQPLTPSLRSELNLPAKTNGVLVGDVLQGSKAEESGVQAGDVIERVGGDAVNTPVQVADAIRAAQQQKKQAVSLLVRRNGVSSYLGLQLADS